MRLHQCAVKADKQITEAEPGPVTSPRYRRGFGECRQLPVSTLGLTAGPSSGGAVSPSVADRQKTVSHSWREALGSDEMARLRN